MKNIMYFFVALVATFFISCSSNEQEKVSTVPQFVEEEQTIVNGDKLFELQGDARRVQHGVVMFELFKEKYRTQYPTVIDSLIAKPEGNCNCASRSQYLQVNQQTCIPLSNKLLNGNQKFFGPNSSFSKAEQLVLINHTACADQMKLFENAFVNALNGLSESTKTILVPNPDYIAPVVNTTSANNSWSAPAWFKDLLWLLLGLVLLALFIWLICQICRGSRNQTNTTSVTESQAAAVIPVQKKCCGDCSSRNTQCSVCDSYKESANAFIETSKTGKNVEIIHEHDNLKVTLKSLEPEDFLPISITVVDDEIPSSPAAEEEE
ncbi:MAG: hypothetical protein MRY57_04175 [Candidatus Pacebacteria bacterium]|nr:hypothetical protein [Candidatus Paceibacterota bacterium]